MTKASKQILLERYFLQGYLDKKYYHNNQYYQPYSANDRLHAGLRFYLDFLSWKRGHLKAKDITIPKVDSSKIFLTQNIASSRFRNIIRHVSPPFIPILYKIVLEQTEIKPPHTSSPRERLYFNDEIKTLLCRGLDELINQYKTSKEKIS